jgi:hypothetical protein
MFMFKPGEKNWMEIDMPFDKKSLEIYEYQYSDDGEGYSVTIEGNPEDEDALITVRIGDDSYQTAIGEIDGLPEKYRKVAKKALENSLKHSKKRVIEKKIRRFSDIPEAEESARKNLVDLLNKIIKEQRIVIQSHDPNDHLRNLQDHLLDHPPDLPKSEPDSKMFDKIEERMRKMQERIDKLEKYLKEIPQRSATESKKEQI